MPTVDNASIDELQSAIRASHIMTPRARFVAGMDADDALRLLVEEGNRDLDLIPFPKGDPSAYVLRSDRLRHDISRDQLISDSTPIIELIRYFHVGREALFVLSGNRIAGLIHLSDLNSSLCKIAFFTLVNNLERACLEVFRPELPDWLLRKAFTTNFARLKEHIEKKRQSDTLPFDAAALYFRQILKLVQVARAVTLTDEEIKALNEVRNRTAHAGHDLFSHMDNLGQLKSVVEICERVLDELSENQELRLQESSGGRP